MKPRLCLLCVSREEVAEKYNQYDIYFQTAAQGTIEKVQATGEPLIPAFADLLKVYNARHLSASEVCQVS